MLQKSDKNKARQKRHLRVRNHIHGTAERPRLTHRGNLLDRHLCHVDRSHGESLAEPAIGIHRKLRHQLRVGTQSQC